MKFLREFNKKARRSMDKWTELEITREKQSRAILKELGYLPQPRILTFDKVEHLYYRNRIPR